MYVFLQCVAEAVVAKGVRGLAELVPGGGYLFDVANEAHKRLRDRKRVDQIRDEVVSIAAAGVDEVRKVAEQVVKEVAPNASPSEKAVLELYLTQIPGAVRQSFRRSDDPSGKSVPDQFALADPGDLARRLPSRLPKFRAGDPLPGRPGWVLGELLGSGGFGEVWLARNPSLAALKGAVKFGIDPQARERLLRHEGGLVSRVMEEGRHPNIVPLLDAHLEGDTPWLMYEYVGGGDLGALIHAWQSLLPAERVTKAVTALRTLAAAVGHFHRLSPPLVHRDLKPANILVGTDRGATTVRVADFGIGGLAADAALAAEASRRSSGYLGSQLWGSHTPLYASPQQQRGEKPDPKDDVHALGVIGFQMLTGRLDAAPGADFARTLRRLNVSEPLIELLGDCAAHDTAHRPRDAADLADRLARLDAGPAPVTEATQVVGCPGCGVSLRFRAGATALRCTRCKLVFNPSAAAAPPPVVEARVAPPEPRPEPIRAARSSDTRTRRRDPDDDRPRRKDRPAEPGIHPGLIVGGVLGAVFVLVVVVMVFRGSGTPPVQPEQQPTNPGGPQGGMTQAKNSDPPPTVGGMAPAPGRAQGPPPLSQKGIFRSPKLGAAEYLCYSGDKSVILGVTPAGEVTVAQAFDGKHLFSYATGIKGVRPVFLPKGKSFLSPGTKGGIYVVNPETGIDNSTPLPGLSGKVTAMAVNQKGTLLAAGSDLGHVAVWEVDKLSAAHLLKRPIDLKQSGPAHADPVKAVEFIAPYNALTTASATTVCHWESLFGKWDRPPKYQPSPAGLFALDYQHNKQWTFGGAADRLYVWKDRSLQESPIGSAKGGLGALVKFAVSQHPFEPRYAALSADGKVGFWDGDPLEPVSAERDIPPATDIAFNRSGNMLAAAHPDGSVSIWCYDGGKRHPWVRITDHGAEVVALAWGEGNELTTVDKTGRGRVWGGMSSNPTVGPLAFVKAPQ